METFLETPGDMEWLAEVHWPLAWRYKKAILYGNEDCPTRIELFAVDRFGCRPTVLEPDKNGKLVVIQWGWKPRK